MLAQYFHDAAIGTEFVVNRDCSGHEATLRRFKRGVQAVGVGFVRTIAIWSEDEGEYNDPSVFAADNFI